MATMRSIDCEGGGSGHALADAMPLPLLTVRVDGTVLFANGLADEALGVEPGGLIGRNVLDFGFDGDEGGGLSGMLAAGVRRTELRARRADGRPLWVLASAQPVAAEGDARALLVFQDVTEIRLRESALTEANEEAERSIRARMRFLAATSHDLRQPLQALALFASALDHHVHSPQARTILQSMKISLRGMEEMFDSLMDMSKLDAGVMKAEVQVFLINDVFEQLETTYGPQAEAAGLELRVVASSAAVKSDPRMLARILGNFLSNAVRYTRRGRILMGVRHRGGNLSIGVSDTGPGIPESQRLLIFREFCRGGLPSVSGHGGGQGLGLAIVQRLARLLGHRLDVRSEVGRGSTFAVEVPLAEEWCVADAATDEADDGREVIGATVVVIDDDRDIQDGLEMLLSNWGCRAVVADTAERALAALDSRHLTPDVILADLHLQEKGAGIDAIHAIRAITGGKAPAFLFTGDTEIPDRAEFPILRKPLDPLRLRAVLADALGR